MALAPLTVCRSTRRLVRSRVAQHGPRNHCWPNSEERKVNVMRAFVVKSKWIKQLALFALVIGVLGGLPLLSAAHVPSNTVTIVNNTSTEIRHVYFSATTDNNWGPDHLSNSVIPIGGSQTRKLSCGGVDDIKVVAEDEDGCFYYQVVSCSDNSSWTIDSNSVRDCGN